MGEEGGTKREVGGGGRMGVRSVGGGGERDGSGGRVKVYEGEWMSG